MRENYKIIFSHFSFVPSIASISDESSPLWGLSVANHYLKASVHRKVESEVNRRQKFLSEEHELHQAQFVGRICIAKRNPIN